MNKVNQFRQMHNQLFFLPNAWDAGSAKILEADGYRMLATTSAGIAFSKGYPDGECISFDVLKTVVKEMTDVISIPLSVDFERGYSEDLIEVKSNARTLLELGVVGFNIEDGLPKLKSVDNLDDYLDKIKAILSLKDEGYDFVLNARVDAYLLGITDNETILINRANILLEAGVECIYIPGVLSEQLIALLSKGIKGPLNIYTYKGIPTQDKLIELGVKRVSSGSSMVRACIGILSKMTLDEMNNHSMDYKTVNDLFK